MTIRVVITGYGITSPIGNTPEEFWTNLEAGNSGIDTIKKFDATATGLALLVKLKIFLLINTLCTKTKNAWTLLVSMLFIQRLKPCIWLV
jgi:3-oxoacyl-(acyl-carrier-protein) synthase